VGLSSSDEEALRQKVVLPEIQRLLQAEREANEEVRWPTHHLDEGSTNSQSRRGGQTPGIACRVASAVPEEKAPSRSSALTLMIWYVLFP
jgi:hypothetical protein